MKIDTITNKAEILGNLNPNDEFYTPKYAIQPLLKYIKPNSSIWCPFDTSDSNYFKLLSYLGHRVFATHIDDKNQNINWDFFDIPIEEFKHIDYIISNPPYSIKYEVFKRLFEIGRPFAMLVGVVGLFESKKRFELFRDNNFEIMYFDKRISYFKDYKEPNPSLNPPFSSVYICAGILPQQIVFETINK